METYTLITGAASGFGRAIALKLAPTRNLILADMNAEKLEATRLACDSSEKHLTWVRDLSQLTGIGDDLAALLAAKIATVDHFVHSAGLFGFSNDSRARDGLCEPRVQCKCFRSDGDHPAADTQAGEQRRSAQHYIPFKHQFQARRKGHYVYAGSKAAVNAMMLSWR